MPPCLSAWLATHGVILYRKKNYTLPLPSPLYCLGRPRVGCQRKLEESKDSFRESEREMKELSNEDQTDRQTMLIFTARILFIAGKIFLLLILNPFLLRPRSRCVIALQSMLLLS